jgi:hypothetical protein
MQKLWHQYERNNGVILTRGLNTPEESEEEESEAEATGRGGRRGGGPGRRGGGPGRGGEAAATTDG